MPLRPAEPLGPPTSPSPVGAYPPWRPALAAAFGLAVLLLWDASPGDLWLAQAMARDGRFAWREHVALTGWAHDMGKSLGWAVVVWLCVGLRWP